MELNERETLVKVEQQLTNSIQNQANISSELREFLMKLEKNDKALGLLQIELKTHMGEAPIRREDLKNRLININKEIDDLKKETKDAEDKFDKEIEDLEGAITTEKTERGTFETTVKTSVRNFKIFISVIVGLFSFLLVLLKIMPSIMQIFN